MTAVVQVNEQYAQQFQKLIHTLPKEAIKITMIKNNLNEEILKRINEVKNSTIKTEPLSRLSHLRGGESS